MEAVPPLSSGGIQHANDAIRRSQKRVGVVLNVVAPVTVGYKAMDLAKLAPEQSHEVDHVYALIEQHASSGNLAFGAPVRLIERNEFSLSVHPTHIDDAAEFAGP